MIEIKEVITRKQVKEFIEFPLNLYKNNPYFIPPIYMDEKALFKKNFVYKDVCEQVFYLAYKDSKVVGRIQGILQKQYNEIHNEKRVRFSRFDSIDDKEVSRSLFKAVEDWAVSKGMDTVCGPLGYSDLEREGMLIEGFEELNTFEEQYNYPYYQALTEDSGYIKEVDWLESRLTCNDEGKEKIKKLSEMVLKRYNLHYVVKEKGESNSHFIDRVVDGVFYLIDEGYKKLYGVVPFTQAMKDQIMSEFKLFIDPKFISIVANDEGRIIAFGLSFPGFGAALQKSGGRLTIPCIFKLLKLLKHPKSIDLGLVAVDPEYLNKGVNAPIMAKIMDAFDDNKCEYLETNLNLEENYKILAFWKYFNQRQHKRRRSFIKRLN